MIERAKNELIAKNSLKISDYIIEKTYVAGIVLQACEVRCLYESSCSLRGSYIKIIGFIPHIWNMYIKITEYRSRLALLNKKEIIQIDSYIRKGYVAFPISMYKKNNLMKLSLVLAKKVPQKGRKEQEKKMRKELGKEAKKITKGICHF